VENFSRERETAREGTQAGGAAGRGRRRSSLPAEQGTRHGAQSQDPGIDMGLDPKIPGS